MTRDEALAMLQKYITNQILLQHALATEATMKTLAAYFGENEETWAAAGLLHDADYEMAKGHPEKHGLLLFDKEKTIPADIVLAIKAHNFAHTGVMPKSRMDWALACCDDLTAFIVAATLSHPSKKISQITVDFVMNKMRQKNFAKGANRAQIFLCQQKLGIPLIEFVTITLRSMQGISVDLGL